MFGSSLRAFIKRFFRSNAETIPVLVENKAAAPSKHETTYLKIMLGRLAAYSENHLSSFVLPETLYHASLYKGLPQLDPKVGQGLGVWFMDSLEHSAQFALTRQYHPITGKRYPKVEPTIYEAKVTFRKLAIFPDEVSLYKLALTQDDDPVELQFGIGLRLPRVAEILREQGYDGIYLQQIKTFSALHSEAITICCEHDPKPINQQLPTYRQRKSAN